MPRPWTLVERVQTPEGPLTLLRSGQGFLIKIGDRVLMSSALQRSEVEVARLGCAPIADRPRARVLIGGLGLGYTLRAALDSLRPDAVVEVAELNPVVVDWCRGPVAALAGDTLADPRVEVYAGDVTDRIRQVALDPRAPRLDAIVLDLYLGPAAHRSRGEDPLYGPAALGEALAALSPDGVYAVWGEERDRTFEHRLARVGFRQVRFVDADGGGPRHAVVIARR